VNAAERFRPAKTSAPTATREAISTSTTQRPSSRLMRRDNDLIISEPSNPWVSGVAGSSRTSSTARAQPPDGGRPFVQWIQLYEIDVKLIASVLKAIEANFSDYAVYPPTTSTAFDRRPNGARGVPSAEFLRTTPGIAASLDRAGIAGVQDLEVRKIGTRRAWEGLTASFRIATEFRLSSGAGPECSSRALLNMECRQAAIFARFPPELEGHGMERPAGSWCIRRGWREAGGHGHCGVDLSLVANPQVLPRGRFR